MAKTKESPYEDLCLCLVLDSHGRVSEILEPELLQFVLDGLC